MGDVLACSFDGAGSPTLRLRVPQSAPGTHPFGWGLGWYPGNGHAATVFKDPVARNTDISANTLSDWHTFRSSVFFCKVKGAAQDYSPNEMQPFSRSFAGRDWLFIHNGNMDKKGLEALHDNRSRFLEPMGRTDSELAFVYLLGKLQQTGARTIADVVAEDILSWASNFDPLGCADFLLTDGISTVCYRGKDAAGRMYFMRSAPGDSGRQMNSETMGAAFDDPRDAYRTVLVFSSCMFDHGRWNAVHPGQMMIACRGAVVWSNGHYTERPVGAPLPPPAPQDKSETAKAETDSAPKPQASPPKKRDPLPMPPNTQRTDTRLRAHPGVHLPFRTFEVSHRTEYLYAEQVEHSTHVFRLQPREDAVQQALESTLIVSVPGEQILYDDVFGNACVYQAINTPYKSLIVESRSRVRLYRLPPDDYTLSKRQSAIPIVWMPWQQQMMMPYLLPPEIPETQLEELTEYALSFAERNGFRLMDTLRDMNLRIYRDYLYTPGATTLLTTPFDVYAERKGVCQDFANLFICLARLLNVPARYRAGYIYTGANYENKIQSEASHAWAEVYLPYIGWRGFDPTNGCEAAQDHVRIACGRNYRDATPTSGTLYKGGLGEQLFVDVKVVEVKED